MYHTTHIGKHYPLRRSIEAVLVTGDEVLIGQTALETLDLLVDCRNQRLVPNPANPDYPVLRV